MNKRLAPSMLPPSAMGEPISPLLETPNQLLISELPKRAHPPLPPLLGLRAACRRFPGASLLARRHEPPFNH